MKEAEKVSETFIHIYEVKGAMKSLEKLFERGHFPNDIYQREHAELERELSLLEARLAAENNKAP